MSFSYENQKKTLSLISEILDRLKFKPKCQMGFGLFLGCIRQGSLNTSINNWDDLDFNVLACDWGELVESVIPELLDNGFVCIHSFINTYGDISEITLSYGEDRIDFHKNYELSNGILHYAWHGGIELGKIMKSEYFLETRQYSIDGFIFFGPAKSIEYLIDLYGDGWKTPCKSEGEYRFWEDSPGIPWTFRKKGERILKGEYRVK